ncbi:helicase [Halobacteriales archaeon SW_7_68_16]|nr:MAG: helicase [Halobacteriales archaeon SW_7_68_16]
MTDTAGEGYERFFPYDDTYENQGEAMDRIATALRGGRDVLFEGACGTGKTLSALVPALAHARETGRTVVITTNVHQQTRQFIEEGRAITREEPIRGVVFRGKESMCHIDVGFEECQALRDATRTLVEAQEEYRDLRERYERLREASREGDDDASEARDAIADELDAVEGDIEEYEEAATCSYYRSNLTESTAEFYAWLYDDVRTPDDIFEFAERAGFCGYELLKDGMEDVDLVVCNYHHLLDPMIREQFFRWLDCDPGDVIAVFDEAHNVASVAREHATETCSERTFEAAIEEVADEDDPRATHAENLFATFRDALTDVYGERCPDAVGDEWIDCSIVNEEGRDDLTVSFLRSYEGRGVDRDIADALALGSELKERYEEAYKSGEREARPECRTLTAAAFVRRWLDGDGIGQYPVVSVRRDEGTDEVYGRAEAYACLPGSVTRPLFDGLHATVLMSATLRPFDVVRDTLGLADPTEMAYGLTFPPENRRTFAVDTPPLFASDRDDPGTVAAVADALADLVRFTPGNVLAFFPSYAEADRYRAQLADRVTAPTYLDEPGVRAEDRRTEFVAEDGAVLCTSLWGTLAEGVSFDGDDARGVAVVGVPYPHLDDRKAAIQAAYDDAFEGENAGWRYGIEVPTVRKTRQALGRVLRSPEDVGVRALFDARYTARSVEEMGQYSVRETFPTGERDELIDVDPEKLKYAALNFFSDRGAYHGEPPVPE